MTPEPISAPPTGSVEWDVLVCGAGLAGGMTALLAARQGLKVLLVDSKAFPRDKVCGGCLNPRAVQLLHQHGLAQFLESCGAVPIDQLVVLTGARPLTVPLPHGLAVSRRLLDQHLIEEATDAGGTFLQETTANVVNDEAACVRKVALSHQGRTWTVTAKVVVIADGLRRSSVKTFDEFATQRSDRARIGMGGSLCDKSGAYRQGTISMAVGRDGYVGITHLEHDCLNIACALDPKVLRGDRASRGSGRTAGGSGQVRQGPAPGEVILGILKQARAPVPVGIETVEWHGTPLLSSRPRQVAARRLFLIGDSAGYVEPFTGEGMAAALECAAIIAQQLPGAVNAWNDDLIATWSEAHRRTIGQRQWVCRFLAKIMRYPGLVKSLLPGCQWFPAIPQFLVKRVSAASLRPTSLS